LWAISGTFRVGATSQLVVWSLIVIMSEPYVIKSDGFTPVELRDIADMHSAELGGFLASLGRRALHLMYEHMGTSHTTVLVAAYGPEASRPVGFVSGTVDCAALYRGFLRRQGMRALVYLVRPLASATRLRKAVEILLYPARRTHSPFPRAELLSFVVTDPYKGSGLARELFSRVMGELKARGVQSVKLVTGSSQERAHSFYEKMGAHRKGSLTRHKGETSWVYVYDIP
jgi:ribosomal protein S18 acetylase RimI-like enzyme